MKNKEGSRINKESEKWNREHKKECSFFNWVARINNVLKGKDIYPVPSQKEIQAFKELRERRKWD